MDVKKGRIISGLSLVFVGMFVLFDVDFVFDLAGPSERQIADPETEAGYEACFAARDHEIHETAFGTIDNPEVQKEFITSNRVRVAEECRARYPEKIITVEEPAHFNLAELKPRFW